ncbi:MAG TPA: homoserine O-acetyltransferase [Phycisphaerae bacterium]|nr:homoserine O-acetyltransferase [Phycisphaerae bacterium]HRY68103.1 homoserine O-acetyltransferase [Phycisphaerae bacterium]HSA28814.1 homoserine O-acetyltransferase [Phycisphaerae bacterium]
MSEVISDNLEGHPKLQGSIGIVRPRTVTLFERPDLLQLECGRELGPIQVTYETCGALDEDHGNAVLIFHALSGDAHVAGYHSIEDRKAGWWENMVGPGKGIDTDKYFVICANTLGGCRGTTGPSSINPDTGKPWGLDFPVITIEDMVKVQKALVDHLGIKQLLAVIGGSMGGMLVLEWMVRYPDLVKVAIPIATTPRQSAQCIAFDAVGRSAILADPNFRNGQYHDDAPPEDGLAIARMVGHITYLSEQGMHEKFGRQLRHAEKYSYDFTNEFSVETYLDYQGRAFVQRFDANSYLYITKALDYYDLGGRCGSLVKAFENIKASVLAISLSGDWLYTAQQSRMVVDALLANGKTVSYSEINSPYGHDAFLLEPNVLGRLISGALAAASGRPVLDRGDDLQPYLQAPVVKTAWHRQRIDYDRIEDLITPDSRVLDLGCGPGLLLSRLMHRERVRGLGVEVVQDSICQCVERGIPVVDLDIETELSCFPDQSYDYVVLSQTLQTLRRPDVVLDQMLRIGRHGIVSFPNLVYWKPMLQMLLTGRTPVTESLPFWWYNTPNVRCLTIRDFEAYCREQRIRVHRKIALLESRRQPIVFLPSLRAAEAIFVISRKGR